jgi:tetratricopeptide (TPR) repeat protein
MSLLSNLLAAARTALDAALPDGCIDTAARVHADASATARERAEAAILAARGHLAKGLWSDALIWCDRAGDELATEVATYRGWLHYQRGDKEAALAELARALRPEAPAIASWYRAVVLDDLGRRTEAYASLGEIVDDKDLGAAALRLRGLWRLEDGNRDEGLADLAVSARRGDATSAKRLHDEDALPDEPETKFAYAYAIQQDDLDGATAAVEELLERTDLAPAFRGKVRAQLALYTNWGSNFDGAVEHYGEAAALAPEHRGIVKDYGHALYNVDRNDEALVVLERARALPGDVVLDAKIDALIGDIHFVANRRAKAVEYYERSLESCPRQPAIMSRCAHSLEDIGRTDEAKALRFAAAIAGDEQAIEACGIDDVELPASLHDNGCFGLTNHGEPNRVAQTLDEAAQLWLGESRAWGDFCARHAAMALSNQSYALAKAERRDEAAEAGRRAVELRPGFRDGWNNYGNQLVALDRFDDALAAFDRAAWCDPTYAGAYYGKADVLRRTGNGPGTVAALLRAAEIGYEDTMRQRDIHFRLARAYQAMGQWAESEEQWRKATELEGDEDYTAAEAVAQIAKLVERGVKAKAKRPPYRRYGLRPSTWHLSTTIAARLQLEKEPDEDLVTEIEDQLVGDVKVTGRFVEIAVEVDPDDGFPAEGFEAIEAAADAIHAITPVVEVVGYNAIGLSDDDPGEQWSIATQPVPDAGPEPSYHVAFWPFAFAAQP